MQFHFHSVPHWMLLWTSFKIIWHFVCVFFFLLFLLHLRFVFLVFVFVFPSFSVKFFNFWVVPLVLVVNATAPSCILKCEKKSSENTYELVECIAYYCFSFSLVFNFFFCCLSFIMKNALQLFVMGIEPPSTHPSAQWMEVKKQRERERENKWEML